jgi:TrmH family RNA methyltransferase
MEIIRSRQNPMIRQLIKLATQRRERLKQNQTLLLGSHLIASALQNNWPLEQLFICEGEENHAEIIELSHFGLTRCTVIDRQLFQEIEQNPSSCRVFALFSPPKSPPVQTQGFCLLLDGIQDPGNVGTILRTAAAAAVDQVWLSTDCADVWSPKVLRAGMGAHFLIPIIERIDIEQSLLAFQGEVAITALDNSTSLYHSSLLGNLVFVLGSEGAGISAASARHASKRLFIPMQQGLESLNVSAAAAICLYERVRQTLLPPTCS